VVLAAPSDEQYSGKAMRESVRQATHGGLLCECTTPHRGTFQETRTLSS